MIAAANWIFMIILALAVYHHVIYPLILPVLARRFGRQHLASQLADDDLPAVTLIIPAYNEAQVIERKLRNTQQLDYPAGKVSGVVADDGSTDGTAEIAQRCAPHAGWQTHVRARNSGKISVLNDEIAASRTEVVALSDASALLNSDALRLAAAHFADPDVGVVCGTYRLDGAAPEGERAYWRYQTAIKEAEGDLHSPLGVHGAFYLFRKSLWRPLPSETINDDVILPMSIVLKSKRCVYEPKIVATEIEPSSAKADFHRRIRIGAGNLQQVLWLWPLANPRHGWLAFIFLSGKFLRAMMPVMLAMSALIAAGLALAGSWPYQLALGLMAVIALFAWVLPAGSRLGYFASGYVASGLGALMYLTGSGHRAWQLSSLVNRSRP